jgi:hypothetical protein
MFFLQTVYTPGRTVRATVRKWNRTGTTLGQYWNNTTAAWQDAAVSDADTITLVGSDNGLYVYGRTTALSTYTGAVIIEFKDSTITLPLTFESAYLLNGQLRDVPRIVSETGADLQDGGRLDTQIDAAAAGGVELSISPFIVNAARTFVIPQAEEMARNIVSVNEGAKVTVAFDFSAKLNEGAGVLSIVSVVDIAGSVTPVSQQVSQDRKKVHATFTSFVSGTTSTVLVICNTTDGDKLTGRGVIKVS